MDELDMLFVVEEDDCFQLKSYSVDSAGNGTCRLILNDLPVTECTTYARVGQYVVMVGGYRRKDRDEMLKEVVIYDVYAKKLVSNPPRLLAPKGSPLLVPLGPKLFAFSTIVAHRHESRLHPNPRIEVLDIRDLRCWAAISNPKTPEILEEACLYVIVASTSCTSTSSIYLSLGSYCRDYMGCCSLMFSDSTQSWLSSSNPLPFCGTAICCDDVFFGFPASEKQFSMEVCSYSVDHSCPGTFRFVALCSFALGVGLGFPWPPYLMSVSPLGDNTLCLSQSWVQGIYDDIPQDHVLVLSKIKVEDVKAKEKEKAVGFELEKEKATGVEVEVENEKAEGVEVKNEEAVGKEKGKKKAVRVKIVKEVGEKKRKRVKILREIQEILQETERECREVVDEANDTVMHIETTALKEIDNLTNAIVGKKNKKVARDMCRMLKNVLTIDCKMVEEAKAASGQVGSVLEETRRMLMAVELELKKEEKMKEEDKEVDEEDKEVDEEDKEVDEEQEKSKEFTSYGLVEVMCSKKYEQKARIQAFVGESHSRESEGR